RKRKGMTLYNAKKFLTNRDYFGSMMVEAGEADVFLTGSTRSYAASLKPARNHWYSTWNQQSSGFDVGHDQKRSVVLCRHSHQFRPNSKRISKNCKIDRICS